MAYHRDGMKKRGVILAACLLAAALAPGNGCAQEAPGPAHRNLIFPIDTSMVMFGSPTTRFFLGWQQDANAAFQLGLDGVVSWLDLWGPHKELQRFAVLAVFSGAGLIVNQAFSLTAHDESHLEAARAIGATNVMLVRSSDNQQMGIGDRRAGPLHLFKSQSDATGTGVRWPVKGWTPTC